jgi:hypothetical protein
MDSNLPLNSSYTGLEDKERGAIMASAVDKSVQNADGNLSFERRKALVMDTMSSLTKCLRRRCVKRVVIL